MSPNNLKRKCEFPNPPPKRIRLKLASDASQPPAAPSPTTPSLLDEGDGLAEETGEVNHISRRRFCADACPYSPSPPSNSTLAHAAFAPGLVRRCVERPVQLYAHAGSRKRVN
ncbi:hypothetical protein EDB89DRAFT_2077029 [Lactarius sanguifluus]|nr:hypothetical protein EDB89DRAFT_2077029 [Lactarius sanguifluus]